MAVLEYLAELLAFAIVVWLVVRYVAPIVRRTTAQRQQAIKEQLEASRADKAAAEKAEAEFNRAHEGLAVETARLRDDARNQSEQIVAELQERARTESARILNRGQEQLAAERDTAVRHIRSDAGLLTAELAELVVNEYLRDERRRRTTVERALDGISADAEAAARTGESALTPASTEGRI